MRRRRHRSHYDAGKETLAIAAIRKSPPSLNAVTGSHNLLPICKDGGGAFLLHPANMNCVPLLLRRVRIG